MSWQAQRLEVKRDNRGSVYEPVAPEDLSQQQNVHVVWTQPGCVRGNHCHERSTEILIVQGPALVRFREHGVVTDHQVPEGEVCRFTIPPGISHAIQQQGQASGLLLSFNTAAYDPNQPDLVKDVLIEG